ncbi:hypothetical protein GCK32_018024, partial [Trichostrongylus colubriformis]
GASVFVSTFSLSAIALDRYNLVVRPHRHPLRSRGASVVALLLWIISALVCMPYGWYMDVVRINGLCGEFCTEIWPLPEVRKGYALMVLVMQFILPFATMAVCYYTIFARLRERTESKLKKLSERTQLLESAAGNSSPSAKNVSSSPSYFFAAQYCSLKKLAAHIRCHAAAKVPGSNGHSQMTPISAL